MDKFIDSLRELWNKTQPFREKTKAVLKKIGSGLANFFRKTVTVADKTGKVAYKMRSIMLAIPVLFGAVILAIVNAIKLPTEVGINLLADGEYAFMVHKLVAVSAPLLVTAICLLLMFCSKKVVYPFLISLFSLALPLLILLINVFPF